MNEYKRALVRITELEGWITELLDALETLERAHLKNFIDLKNFRKRTGKAIRKAKGE